MALDREFPVDAAEPWYARFIKTVGPTTAIALFLVWLMAWSFRDDLKKTTEAISQMQQNFALHHSEVQRLNSSIEYYMKIQTSLQRQTCVNAAETTDQRAGCFKE